MNKYFPLFVILIFLQCSNNEKDVAIYNVHNYGAKGDGITNDHDAVQKAIDACKGTGGIVLFPEGTFLTGQLVLGSFMTIKIDSLATILGIQSDTEDSYPHHKIETRYPNRMLQDCQLCVLSHTPVSPVRKNHFPQS